MKQKAKNIITIVLQVINEVLQVIMLRRKKQQQEKQQQEQQGSADSSK